MKKPRQSGAGKAAESVMRVRGGCSAHAFAHQIAAVFFVRALDMSREPVFKKPHDIHGHGNLALLQVKVTVTMDVMRFLKNWLTGHIKGTDKKYSGYLVRKGVR